jgi:hypothetical protein
MAELDHYDVAIIGRAWPVSRPPGPWALEAESGLP